MHSSYGLNAQVREFGSQVMIFKFVFLTIAKLSYPDITFQDYVRSDKFVGVSSLRDIETLEILGHSYLSNILGPSNHLMAAQTKRMVDKGSSALHVSVCKLHVVSVRFSEFRTLFLVLY